MAGPATVVLHPADNVDVVLDEQHELRGHKLARVPIAEEELAGLPVEITGLGEVRTLPSHLADAGGMDGFFIARLQRVP